MLPPLESGPVHRDRAKLHLSEQRSGNNLDVQQPGVSTDSYKLLSQRPRPCAKEEVTAWEMHVMIFGAGSRLRPQR